MDKFFSRIEFFLRTSERQFGVANLSFCEYAIERIELAINSCTIIRRLFEGPHQDIAFDEEEERVIVDYKQCLNELIRYLQLALDEWKQYDTLLEATSSARPQHSYQVPLIYTGRQGRPQFNIDKEQLEYLVSISFSWNEISALLGISRMTLYRYSLFFALAGISTIISLEEELNLEC